MERKGKRHFILDPGGYSMRILRTSSSLYVVHGVYIQKFSGTGMQHVVPGRYIS